MESMRQRLAMNERWMRLNCWRGRRLLQSLEVGEGRDLTALCEMETHIVVHALDVENIVEVDADKLILNLCY